MAKQISVNTTIAASPQATKYRLWKARVKKIASSPFRRHTNGHDVLGEKAKATGAAVAPAENKAAPSVDLSGKTLAEGIMEEKKQSFLGEAASGFKTFAAFVFHPIKFLKSVREATGASKMNVFLALGITVFNIGVPLLVGVAGSVSGGIVLGEKYGAIVGGLATVAGHYLPGMVVGQILWFVTASWMYVVKESTHGIRRFKRAAYDLERDIVKMSIRGSPFIPLHAVVILGGQSALSAWLGATNASMIMGAGLFLAAVGFLGSAIGMNRDIIEKYAIILQSLRKSKSTTQPSQMHRQTGSLFGDKP